MTGQSKGLGAVFTYESLVHAIAGATVSNTRICDWLVN